MAITNQRLLSILHGLPSDATVTDPGEEMDLDMVYYHPGLNTIQLGASQDIPAMLAPGWRVYDLRDPYVQLPSLSPSSDELKELEAAARNVLMGKTDGLGRDFMPDILRLIERVAR